MLNAPPTLLAAALSRHPSAPLITYYDDAADERTELSATTFANWVSKSANLLRDGLDVGPGERVCLLLPAHWQTAVLLFAIWSIGAVPTMSPAGAAVVVADEPSLPLAVGAGARDVLGLSLAPMNGRLTSAPAGVIDYAGEVLAAGDHFDVVKPTGQSETAAASMWAKYVGLSPADRVLVGETDGVAGAIDWLLTPLSAQASVVLCSNADPALLVRRVAQERITATLGVTVEGVRRLDG